jgi:uncharacterized oligopeptide transporter (OPT) family protein
VTPEIERHFMANGNISKRQIILGNFFGGLAWGFGSVLGATIVIALLIGFFKTFNFLPYANEIASTVEHQAREAKSDK